MKKFKLSKILLLVSLFCFLPSLVRAETLLLEVDTGVQEINALEATISLPEGLQVESVLDGSSIILLWVEKPTLLDERTIFFSGVTPGGFRGRQNVLSIVGDFGGSVPQMVSTNVRALSNDGEARVVPVTLRLVSTQDALDHESPEPFVPVITRDANLFEGKHMLVFLTHDKGTGVSYYEYADRLWGKPKAGEWVRVESPHLLERSALFKKVYIKAVDYSENEHVVNISGSYRYFWLIFCGIILLTLLCVLTYPNRLRSYFSSR